MKKCEAQNFWDTAYLVPKNIGNNFHRKKWVSISNFQFYIVLHNLGQHSLDSTFVQFLEAIPKGFLLSYFSPKFDNKEHILRYYRTEP